MIELAEILKKRENHWYRTLSIAQYNSIKNYDLVEKVIRQLAIVMSNIETQVILDGNCDRLIQDNAALSAAKTLEQAKALGFRPMWLAPTLVKAFSHSKLPSKIACLNRVCPVGLILLPTGYIKTPEGKYLKWILFYHALPGDKLAHDGKFSDIIYKPEDNAFAGLFWMTKIDNSISIYGGYDSLSLVDDKLIVDHGEEAKEYIGDESRVLDDNESSFIKRIPNLIIQTLLYMQMEKIVLPPIPDPAPLGFGGKGKTKYKKIPPLIIGENYLIKTQRESTGVSRPHGSPVTHWRCSI